ATAKWYQTAMNFSASGSVMANRYNYYDLDPTYRNAFGQPLMRMTFDYKENEHKIGRHAAQVAWHATRSSVACTASGRPSTAFLAARLARWLITATRGRSGIAASRGRRKPSTPSSPNPRRRYLPTACLTRECRTLLIVPI